LSAIDACKTTQADHRVEDVNSVVSIGSDVYVKVMSIDEAEGKIGLSMKYVHQSTGKDLDPGNSQASIVFAARLIRFVRSNNNRNISCS
jgi:predicted RNA-binding protein with RPS1 domain